MAAAFMSRFTASVNLLFGLPVDILPADSCTRLYLPLNLLGTKPLSQSAGVMCRTQKGFFSSCSSPTSAQPGTCRSFLERCQTALCTAIIKSNRANIQQELCSITQTKLQRPAKINANSQTMLAAYNRLISKNDPLHSFNLT